MRNPIDPEPIIAVVVLLLVMMMMIWAICGASPDPNCHGEYIGHVIQIGETCNK